MTNNSIYYQDKFLIAKIFIFAIRNKEKMKKNVNVKKKNVKECKVEKECNSFRQENL